MLNRWLMSLALAAEAPPGSKPPPIRSTLVLLSGREKPWPAEGEYRTSPLDAPFSGVSFRIDAVYQRTVEELVARGPFWSIFAPLAVDADPTRMKAVLDRLQAEMAPRDFEELAVATLVLAEQDWRQRGLRDAIISVLSKEIVMQSWVWTQGKAQGEQETKREMLARFFGKRLGRPLTEDEIATLVQRLGSLGYDRLAARTPSA